MDDQLDRLLDGLPAVCLEGPRAVGKTSTAVRRARTVHDLDDPETMALAEADPGRLVRGDAPIVIDEWQRYPPSWDLVRRAVDRGAGPGTFLLAGSASPQTAPTHSGAGRIVTLRMRPMSLFERGAASPSVSLAQLLAGGRPDIGGETDAALDHYAREIATSGFPGMRLADPAARPDLLDGYLDRATDHDLSLMGHRARRPGIVRRWLSAYAAATSTTATYETIRDGGHRRRVRQAGQEHHHRLPRPARGDVAGRPAAGVVAAGQSLEPAQARPQAPSRGPRSGGPPDRCHRLGTGGAAVRPYPGGSARGRCSGRSSSRWSPWTCGSTPRPPEPPWGICEHGTTTVRST